METLGIVQSFPKIFSVNRLCNILFTVRNNLTTTLCNQDLLQTAQPCAGRGKKPAVEL